MKQLQLTFKNEIGKTRALSLKYVDESITESTARTAMEQIAASKLVQKMDGYEYVTPVSAKFIERTETPLYTA